MNSGKRQEMMQRTKRFALAVIRLYSALTTSTRDQVLEKQVLRSGTSVGAHYREACRAKSKADFISKIEGALQELDETVYWLELLQESFAAKPAQIEPLTTEANELISIFVTVTRTVKEVADIHEALQYAAEAVRERELPLAAFPTTADSLSESGSALRQ